MNTMIKMVVVVDEENGTRYDGYARDGVWTGRGEFVDRKNKVYYNGQWKNGEISGIGTIRNYLTGLQFNGEFANNQMVRGTMRWENGAE